MNQYTKIKVRAAIRQLKIDLGCAMCQEHDPIVLEYHHIQPKEHSMSMSQVTRKASSINKIRAELELCVILCANCHLRAHAGIFNPADLHSIKLLENWPYITEE